MNGGTQHDGDLEVAVFDGARLVSTRRCRGIDDACSFMQQVQDIDGMRCLILGARLRESLIGPLTPVAA